MLPSARFSSLQAHAGENPWQHDKISWKTSQKQLQNSPHVTEPALHCTECQNLTANATHKQRGEKCLPFILQVQLPMMVVQSTQTHVYVGLSKCESPPGRALRNSILCTPSKSFAYYNT